MYFSHSPEIWQQFPQLAAGLLVVDDVQPDVDLGQRLEPWYERSRERLAKETESQMPEVAAWRRAYAQMGLKPTKYRSAGEALLRRFKREDDLPRLHPLVDLCNAVSLAFALPVAAFDLAGVDSFLEVCHATGSEQYLAFSQEIEHPEPNEVIFVDAANQVHARRWTFRQSRRSVIVPETTQALIVSEGLHETASTDVPALIDTLAAEISELWSEPRGRALLRADAPRLDFDRA
jgi:DNA/RNA-binding domain of Phe-tRNA-synthetase-like protein